MSDPNFYAHLALWSQVGGSVAFFIVVIYLWRRFLSPAIVAAQQRKNDELAEGERRRDKAKEQLEETQRQVGTVESDVRAIRTRAERDAAAEREKLLSEAKLEGERLVRNAEGEPDRLRRAARETLRDELVAQALTIAREAATKVDASTNARLIDEALAAAEHGGKN